MLRLDRAPNPGRTKRHGSSTRARVHNVMPTQSLSGAKAGYQGTTFENMLRECFSCGLVTVDSEGKLLSLSPEAKRLLRSSARKNNFQSLEALPVEIAAIIHEVRDTDATVANRIVVFKPAKKQPLTLSVTAMPVSGKHGASVVAMLTDFSAAARLEQNLRRLDRLASIGTLSAGLAHEIKNALVAVKTFVELLLEKHQDAELSETVRREINRMDSIVTHMLKYASPPQPVFAQVRLHEVLEHSLRMMQPRIASKMILLNRDFHAPQDLLVGDEHQLEQAFLNLLLNAVDAIGSEGALTVSTDLVQDEDSWELHEGNKLSQQLRIRISDTGAGIEPENLPEIFEPFFTTKPRGTGLGLAVTRRIIQEHHGIIRVESQPGKGTTFTILVPADAQSAMN